MGTGERQRKLSEKDTVKSTALKAPCLQVQMLDVGPASKASRLVPMPVPMPTHQHRLRSLAA